MIRDVLAGRATLEGSGNDVKGVNMHPVMAGILVSVSNPFGLCGGRLLGSPT